MTCQELASQRDAYQAMATANTTLAASYLALAQVATTNAQTYQGLADTTQAQMNSQGCGSGTGT